MPDSPTISDEPLKPTLLTTDAELLEKLSEVSDVDSVLRNFAFGLENHDGERTSEADIEKVLWDFSQKLSQHALQNGSIDTDMVYQGFELIAAKMNAIANNKMGTETKKSRFLSALGYSGPQYERKVVVGFTEEEWNRQFAPKLINPELTQNQIRDEVHRILHDFALAPFSHTQQATKWS